MKESTAIQTLDSLRRDAKACQELTDRDPEARFTAEEMLVVFDALDKAIDLVERAEDANVPGYSTTHNEWIKDRNEFLGEGWDD